MISKLPIVCATLNCQTFDLELQKLCKMNKNSRKGQPNGTHTTGLRSFTVVQEQTLIIQADQFRLKFSVFYFVYTLTIWNITDNPDWNRINPCVLQEIQEGKKIWEAELYRINHTNSKGLAVNDFAGIFFVSFTCHEHCFHLASHAVTHTSPGE
jgi:hypothetical protein